MSGTEVLVHVNVHSLKVVQWNDIVPRSNQSRRTRNASRGQLEGDKCHWQRYLNSSSVRTT
eukprot:6184413-Pleurochrysis_carterae.AAC.4